MRQVAPSNSSLLRRSRTIVPSVIRAVRQRQQVVRLGLGIAPKMLTISPQHRLECAAINEDRYSLKPALNDAVERPWVVVG